MIYYTYLYTDPSRNEPIYVGKGKGLRAWVHLKRKDKHELTHRLAKMKRNGVEPIISFLCKDVDEELALLCEEEAIALYGRKDLGKGPLLNLTDGGEKGGRVIWTEERRKLQSEISKNRSVETRAKMSATRKGVKHSKEHPKAISIGILNSELAKNCHKGAKGHPHSPESMIQMMITRKANPSNKLMYKRSAESYKKMANTQRIRREERNGNTTTKKLQKSWPHGYNATDFVVATCS
jgi:hypothetical protein